MSAGEQRAPGSAAVNGQLWGVRAADWAEAQEPTQIPMYLAVLDRLGLGPGASVLDVGCGAGGFCAHAAQRGARVCGLDASEGFIRAARSRLPHADLRVGELEELPYDDSSFDAVTGFNAFQFATRPVEALREARRVVRDGGRVAILVWGPKEQCEMAEIMPVCSSFLPPPPPGASGPFAMSAPGILEELLLEAGLAPTVADDVSCPFVYPNRATAVRAILASGGATKAMQAVGEDAVRGALEEAVARYETPDGGVRLENVFRYAIATR
jgi:SAM-dependent methyltransferase